MPVESLKVKRERAIEVCRRMEEKYGPVECFLDHTSPFRLVISVLLSAQTTDAQVNKVTPELFSKWSTPEALAAASVRLFIPLVFINQRQIMQWHVLRRLFPTLADKSHIPWKNSSRFRELGVKLPILCSMLDLALRRA